MRRLILALTTTTVALGSALTVSGPTTAATPPSPLRVWTPSTLTVDSFGGSIYSDLGVRLVAGDDPFELWSHRPSYDDPIQTEWHSPSGPVALPDGTMTDFGGLADFVTIRVRRASDGTFVRKMHLPGCLNGYGERTRPDAPAHSPYPNFCPTNPYTLGSVMGIQAGWSVSPLGFGAPLQLKPGVYDVSVSIPADYRDLFGISGADGRHDLTLTVVEGGGGGDRPTTPSTSTAPRPSAHRPTADSAGRVAATQPDLRALPPMGIELNQAGTVLRFGATVWNAGDSPLVVDGFRRPDTDEMDAYQYFFDADGNQTGYQLVGSMHWHAGNHNHWHFEDFAQYQLLNADMSVAVKSKKQSFCLANTDAVDYTVPGADWHPESTDLSTACGGIEAQSIREVLSAGSGDTYYQFRSGQAFPIKDLPNGIYYIRTVANPEGNLVESDSTNNEALRKIRISGPAAHRSLTVFQVGVIDEGCAGRALLRGC